MTLPQTETITPGLDGPVLHITLNRPDSRNAMSLTMVNELMAVFERTEHPARGRHGGDDGKTANVRLSTGEHIYCKGLQTIPKGMSLLVSTPGGGGVGRAADRSREQVVQDVRDGLVSAEAAVAVYGMSPSAELDAAAAAAAADSL